MSRYLLPCSCGQKISVSSALAGTTVNCSCGQNVQVPSIRGLRELELEVLTAPSKKSAATREIGGWDIKGIIFVVGLVLFLIGFGLASFNGYVWSQVDIVNHEDAHLAEVFSRIDEQTPVQLLEIWKNVTQHGLGEYQEPAFLHAKRISDSAWQSLQIGIALVIGGIVAGGYSLFAGNAERRRT